MELKGKRVAILLEDLFEDLEFWYPYYRLKEAGAEVISVGAEKGKACKGKNGLPATAEAGIQAVAARDFDAVVIPGGYSPDRMRRHPAMVELVRSMGKAGKVVAAICHGGWMLASADLLRDKRATGFFSIKDDMVNAGARWEDREVVADGSLVTSRQPADLPAFCRTIIEKLS